MSWGLRLEKVNEALPRRSGGWTWPSVFSLWTYSALKSITEEKIPANVWLLATYGITCQEMSSQMPFYVDFTFNVFAAGHIKAREFLQSQNRYCSGQKWHYTHTHKIITPSTFRMSQREAHRLLRTLLSLEQRRPRPTDFWTGLKWAGLTG